MHRPLSLALAALALAAPRASGQVPRIQSLHSPSSNYRLEITWGNGQQGEGAQPARGRLFGPEGYEAELALEHPLAPSDGRVLDTGESLLLEDRQLRGQGEVVTFYGVDGSLAWGKELEQLLPGEILGRVPRGAGTRQWLARPARIEIAEAAEPGAAPRRVARIAVWNGDQVVIDLDTGKAAFREVSDHGTDPNLWLASARDLVLQGRFDDAVPELEHAVELAPAQLYAWHELARCHEQSGRTDAALAALERGVVANPIVASEGTPAGTARRNLWLHVRLAETYARLGRSAEAQRTALACLAVNPDDWTALRLRADWFWEQSRIDEALKLLDATWERMTAQSTGNAQQTITTAALRIGGYLRDRERFAEALVYLREAYDRGTYSETLCRQLSVLHEKLGEYEQALDVLARVAEEMLRRAEELTDPTQRQQHEHRLRTIEQEIVRLDELTRGG